MTFPLIVGQTSLVTNQQTSHKIPPSLLSSSSTTNRDQFATMIRNSQYMQQLGAEENSRKSNDLEGSEESFTTVKKILSTSEVCQTFCDIKNLTNHFEKIGTDITHRMISEVRKINTKLMNLERNFVNNLTSQLESIIQREIGSLKNEILESVKNNT